MKYLINVREVHTQMVQIEAESKEEAIQLVKEGSMKAIYLDGTLEFSHTLGTDTWTIEEVIPQGIEVK